MKKCFFSFAYVILRDPNSPTEMLVVKRSPNDRYFPNLWGLPAGTLRKGESYEEAIQRTAKLKLDIEVEVLGQRHVGLTDRGTHVVEMRLFEARMVRGSPQIRDLGEYGYIDVQWGQPEILLPAQERGSLCCRLLNEWWQTKQVANTNDRPKPTTDA